MTYDLRAIQDYSFGQLTVGPSSLDTTLTSPGFANFPSDLSTTKYVPVILADDSAGVYEVVWATGHTAGSATVTVIRGREGTSSRGWANGSVWRVAPATRDIVPVLTRATLPSDAHLGMRAALSDEMQVVTKAANGWIAPLGNGAARRSMWQLANAQLSSNTQTALTSANLPAVSGNTSPAVLNSSGLLLNTAGFWRLGLQGAWDNSLAKWLALRFSWPNGPWAAGYTTKESWQFAGAGFNAAGKINMENSWVGYVSPAQAAALITLYVQAAQSDLGTVTPVTFTLSAELLGG